jgi:hypothetical protein
MKWIRYGWIYDIPEELIGQEDKARMFRSGVLVKPKFYRRLIIQKRLPRLV